MQQPEEAPADLQVDPAEAPESNIDTPPQATEEDEPAVARVMQRRPSQPLVNRRTLVSQYDELDWEKAYVASTNPASAPTGPAAPPAEASQHAAEPPQQGGSQGSCGGQPKVQGPAPMLRAGQVSRAPKAAAWLPLQLTPYPPMAMGSSLVPSRSSSVPSAQRKSQPVELKQAAFRPNVAAALLQRPVQEWQEDEVIRWLLEVSLAPKELAQVIREQAITGNVLLTLTESDFEELQVPKFGHRRLLMMAATELRAVVAHTRRDEELPLRPASGPALAASVPGRGLPGAPAPLPTQLPAQAAFVTRAPAMGAAVLGAPPVKAKVPLVVKVVGHQRVAWGKAIAVPKVSPPSRPVMRSLSRGGLSDVSHVSPRLQPPALFTPERGPFAPSPRNAVAAEPTTATRTTRSLSPPLRPMVVVRTCGGGPAPRQLAWGPVNAGVKREAKPASSTRMQL